MKSKTTKSVVTIFFITIVSKMIAFVKTMIQAAYFGSNLQTDAYNMAWGMVDNFFFMLTSAIAVAFVPIYIKKRADEGAEETEKFTTKAITFMALLTAGLILVLEWAAPLIMKLIAPSYEGEILYSTILYFRVLVPVLFFSILGSILQNVLNSERVYGFANVGSVINSVVLITVMLLLTSSLGIWALVISPPISYMIQFLVLYTRGHRYGRLSFRYGLKDEALKTIAVQSFPVLLSLATVEINQVVDRALLIGVQEGAVTSVAYAAVIYQFASSLLILPLSTVMFTELSEAGARDDRQTISDILKTICKVSIMIGLPIVLVTEFTSTDIVNIVFSRGKFGGEAIEQASIGLFAYIWCLIPATIKSVVSRAYYGLHDTKRPMVWGILEVVLNIGLSLWLVKDYGILGVVGATGIASAVFIIVMLIDFRRVYLKGIQQTSLKGYWKIAAAGSAGMLMLIAMKDVYIVNSLVDFVVKAMATIGIYMVILLVTREELVQTVLGSIRTKLTGK